MTRPSQSLRTLLLPALLLAPVPADAEGEGQSLLGLLRQIEGLPEAEAFRARDPDPPAALIALYHDTTTPAWLRLRALDALSRFPEPRVEAFLGELAARIDGPTASAAQHAAVAVLVRTFPKEAAARLPTVLSHPDPELRLTAVKIALNGAAVEPKAAARAWLARTRDSYVERALGPARLE